MAGHGERSQLCTATIHSLFHPFWIKNNVSARASVGKDLAELPFAQVAAINSAKPSGRGRVCHTSSVTSVSGALEHVRTRPPGSSAVTFPARSRTTQSPQLPTVQEYGKGSPAASPASSSV
ncbi:hypothetical protein SAMN05216553_10370 [Lentzea fradiae]|uniref:Uncharacterized protein n=1 Tax=Lentzea fradiae TaxID=200378 RepID=A0A1G7NKE9_9PSEU|nr:hypothetical protein SAMN05216553_10370 [Lentzea fradiae]